MGKGIGNGDPVSAAAINGKTIKELDADPFKYAQSHQNDPFTCMRMPPWPRKQAARLFGKFSFIDYNSIFFADGSLSKFVDEWGAD